MSVDTSALQARANELVEMAKRAGLNSIERDLEALPNGDAAAQIGYLAAALGIEAGSAFDSSTTTDELMQGVV